MKRIRRPSVQRYMPLGYLALALALAAMLLPTALRPPQDLQNSSAAFSPDAPPDENPPEALLASLRAASSATAGSVEEVVVEEGGPPPIKKATRGRCYGNPPRQTESLYSALCVPAFTGKDNGGRTAPGVYPDEIRVGIVTGLSSEVPEGPLEKEFKATDTDDLHHMKVWQTYFNERFELYKRYLRFYIIHQSDTEEDQQRASVQKAKTEYDVFTMVGNGAAAVNEAIRLKIIDFGSVNNPVPFYHQAHPYAYSFYMDSWQGRQITSEIACKHYVGKPPGDLNNKQDLSFDYTKPRKWGLVVYQDPTRTGATKMYTDLMAKCGAKFEPGATQEYNLTDNQSTIAATATKMKAAGVTTIMIGVDGYTPAVLTNEAAKIAYYPEWIHAGTGGIDTNTSGRLMEDNQSTHWIGTSPNEIPRAAADKDWYRAYKEVDPEGDPDSSYFRSLQQISGGIQHAGPILTPQSFWVGLKKQPYRTPEPVWSIGGGYGEPMDYTYMDYSSLIWFDLAGDDPDSSLDGAWCHVWEGKRFKVGEIPTGKIPWFDKKASPKCIFTPARGQQG